ncbi:MAG: Tetratricopeptide 2 repeat protein [Phycisphaerales bacterium]|nr:Tetratricopeptide 2 repeat protein [Phycisphaerales bacterium]
MKTARRILAAALAGLTGCASPRATAPKPPAAPTTQPAAHALDSKVTVALRDIQPPVALAAPTTSPASTHPPMEAVLLYAQARIALAEGERATAENRLEKVITLDPLSYELHRTLGRLYLGSSASWDEHSIDELERAAAIEPNHLDLQTDLGRQYMAKGDAASGLRHLRMALLTSQYNTDAAQATIADFFLSAALLGEGYERAALEIYQRLADRLTSPTMALRMRPEVDLLIGHLDEINGQIAGLLVRQGRYDEAASLLAREIVHNPANFELRATQVHALLAAGRKEDATHAATAAVERFNAGPDSLSLLREAYRAAGHESEATAAVSRLHHDHPGNRPLFYALLDMLRADGNDPEARRLLEEAAGRNPEDIENLRRRFDIARGREGGAAAARLLIETVAAHPDLAAEVTPLWWPLLRPSPLGRLRYTELATLNVSASAAASKAFWVARLAASAHRDDVARRALEQSLKASPTFAPALRETLDDIWSQPDLDASAKAVAIKDLTDRAANSGNKSLAAELRGLLLFRQEKPKEAADAFAQAMQLGGHSPDLLMERVEALRQTGDDPAADALLWKLISDRPTLSEAYLELYASLATRGIQGQAEHVVATWLNNDPQNPIARRMRAFEDLRAGRNDVAEAALLRLFHERPGDAQAVADLGLLYARKQHLEQFALHLQEHLAQEPGDIAAASALAGAYAADKRMLDAAKVLDAARSACAKDPDLLYSLSAINARVGRKDESESLLREVLRLDPSHPGAANDLGYVMTEQGRGLAEAESLIRGAVQAEPHNASFLDSMGWLLYKRGRFEEARIFLDRAVGGAKAGEAGPQPDPVVLDHRGDVLYRLGRREAAAADWQRAAERVTELRGNRDDAPDDVKTLRQGLQNKARQLKEGQAVEVAPIEPPATQPASIGKF